MLKLIKKSKEKCWFGLKFKISVEVERLFSQEEAKRARSKVLIKLLAKMPH
jgi:hypothetical protein